MKNLSLVINVILIILVGYLYFSFFSDKTPDKGNKSLNVSAATSDSVHSGSPSIAYIDLDSLQSHYKYYQNIKAEFEKKQTAANNEIVSLQKKFQSRTGELQQKAAGMTPAEQEKAMAEINQMQQSFQTRKENLDKELFDYNTRMKDDILSKIETYLKDYNKDRRYSYIFSYEPGFMFYKDSTLNITDDVVNGLNAAFNEKGK